MGWTHGEALGHGLADAWRGVESRLEIGIALSERTGGTLSTMRNPERKNGSLYPSKVLSLYSQTIQCPKLRSDRWFCFWRRFFFFFFKKLISCQDCYCAWLPICRPLAFLGGTSR